MSVAVLAVTTGLGTGGAERMLTHLATRGARHGIRLRVLSLGEGGPFEREIAEAGVPVEHLGVRGPAGAVLRLARLTSIARQSRPAVVQGWMYHGNLAALVAALAVRRRPPLCWSIRQSLAGFDEAPAHTRGVIRLGGRLSRTADLIVYNSQSSARDHEGAGYHRAATRIVPNGFDVERFRPDAEAAPRLRAEIGAAPNDVLIGYVARRHSIKDHGTWIRALARLAERGLAVRGVLVGAGTDARDLAEQARDLGIGGRLHGLGERHDVERVVAALDIAASSSAGEGFPNALGEAMACGVPCVATDVGATAELLGDCGTLVRPADPEALAAALAELVAAGPERRRALGALARERVATRFGIDAAVAAFAEMWIRLARR